MMKYFIILVSICMMLSSAVGVFAQSPQNLQAEVDSSSITLTWELPDTSALLYESFEGQGIPEGWLNVDHDGDGEDWFIYLVDPHTGLQSIASASWIPPGNPLTPDNWLITPAIELQSEAVLRYYIAAQDVSWPQEHYKVALSTTGTTVPEDFTVTLFEETLEEGQRWFEREIDLSEYIGETVHIAFVHYDVTDMFFIKLDDVEVSGSAPSSVVKFDFETPDQAEQFTTVKHYPAQKYGQAIDPTALPEITDEQLTRPYDITTIDGYKIYRRPAGRVWALLDSIPADVLTYVDPDPAEGGEGRWCYQVTAVYSEEGESEPSNEACGMIGELGELVFEDDFESYPDFVFEFSPWTLIDADGLRTYDIREIDFPNETAPLPFLTFTPALCDPPAEEADPHSDSTAVVAIASVPAGEQYNDDWLVSPAIDLGINSHLIFWARSYVSLYGLERFKVAISTTEPWDPDAFTTISHGNYDVVPTEWTECHYNLSDYDGEQVYIAINCVSEDALMFMVDDFAVYSNGGTDVDHKSAGVKIPVQYHLAQNYPNPFNPTTRISYSLPQDSPVTLKIYNTSGQLVRTLINAEQETNQYTVTWDGTNDAGDAVASGIYFYQLSAGDFNETKQMVLLK